MEKPKDINELADQLGEIFAAVKTDPRKGGQAKQMTNAAGKILGCMKLQIELAALMGQEPSAECLKFCASSGISLKTSTVAKLLQQG